MPAAPEFRAKTLSRRANPEDYRVYRAGLEWDLTDPIVIDTPDDFKSKQRWRDKLSPYHHQATNLITFCRRLPVTLLADDVGLGKTISAGLIMSELMSRSRVSKVLIVCPKLLGPQWKEELEGKFGIPAEIAIGADLVKVEPEEVGAVITTYHSARIHLERFLRTGFSCWSSTKPISSETSTESRILRRSPSGSIRRWKSVASALRLDADRNTHPEPAMGPLFPGRSSYGCAWSPKPVRQRGHVCPPFYR